MGSGEGSGFRIGQFEICNLGLAICNCASLLALCLTATPLHAHDLHVFAQVEGTTIRGKAYFRGGSPARNVEVIDRDPNGNELGRAMTDEQGKFSLEARVRCDHKLMVDLGDGHGDASVVFARDLPASLPVGDSVGQVSNLPTSESPASPPSSPENAAPGDPLATQIEQLHRDVQGLREQLDGYEKTTRFRDILGGIGFIVGVTGVAYYVLARKRKL